MQTSVLRKLGLQTCKADPTLEPHTLQSSAHLCCTHCPSSASELSVLSWPYSLRSSQLSLIGSSLVSGSDIQSTKCIIHIGPQVAPTLNFTIIYQNMTYHS